jgi:prevent-host-death family protein
MEVVNIHDAKTRLSQLLEKVRRGDPFVLAKAGRPIARVTPIEEPSPARARRIGFLAGEIEVPADFDRMGDEEIEGMFGADDAPAS